MPHHRRSPMLSTSSLASFLLLFTSLVLDSSSAFVQSPARLLSKSKRSNVLRMCICVDCARVTNCAAYHFVESKHEQPHMTDSPTFEPSEGNPTIHVNIRTIRNNEDRKKEIERMWREHKAETKRAEAQAADKSDALYGEEKYDLTPVTTYEYDVVACDDYVEDKGCWVRNMPQEIRDANPHFVPS